MVATSTLVTALDHLDDWSQTMSSPTATISPEHYRKVMGRLPTGVVAITGIDDDGNELGFIVGSFHSLSLDPPIVTFSVGHTSSTWPRIRRRQVFTANVLSSTQVDACRALAGKERASSRRSAHRRPARRSSAPRLDRLDRLQRAGRGPRRRPLHGDRDGRGHGGRRRRAPAVPGRPVRYLHVAQPGAEPRIDRSLRKMEKNRTDFVLNAWRAAWGNGEVEAFERILAPGYVRHTKSGDEDIEMLRRAIRESRQAFPDLDTEILQSVEQDDMVAIRWSSHGTHTGSFMGCCPRNERSRSSEPASAGSSTDCSPRNGSCGTPGTPHRHEHLEGGPR